MTHDTIYFTFSGKRYIFFFLGGSIPGYGVPEKTKNQVSSVIRDHNHVTINNLTP
jgi:hypothetical protein